MLVIREASARADVASRFIARQVGPAGLPRTFRPAPERKSTKAKAIADPLPQVPDDETTAAALVYYCWRYCMESVPQEIARRSCRALCDIVAARCRVILAGGIETGEKALDPYAVAMLGRSMIAAWKFSAQPEYLDLAQLVAAFLIRHELLQESRLKDSDGFATELQLGDRMYPEYRKAAGLFRMVARQAACDDVDLALYGWAFSMPDDTTMPIDWLVNGLYSVEGLAMSESSGARAAALFNTILASARASKLKGAIVQAQLIRLSLVLRIPLEPADGDAFLAMQDPSTGGFHSYFNEVGADVSNEYDVLSTIYAAQALLMLGQNRLTAWPGALQKRDLMFI